MTSPTKPKSKRTSAAKELSKKASPMAERTFLEIVERRFSRRSLLKKGAWAPLLAMGGTLLRADQAKAAGSDRRGGPQDVPRHGLDFEPVTMTSADAVIVPEGYEAKCLIAWGDPLFTDVGLFDIYNQRVDEADRRAGFNNDFLALMPLPHYRSENPGRGILCINNEWAWGQTQYPEWIPPFPTGYATLGKDQLDMVMLYTGMTIVEVERDGGDEWKVLVGGPRNRRVHMLTPIDITGPAAGHDWMKTSYDPTGTEAIGTSSNCGGGVTPYGTVLSGEEGWPANFAFQRSLPASDPRAQIHARVGMQAGNSEFRLERFYDRFDGRKEPNESFRWGWIVEVDPYDPASKPKKRTALGRFFHEGAETRMGNDGRLAVYMGEDAAFSYIFKYISSDVVDQKGGAAANSTILDEGVLHVAKFNEDGTGVWIPMVGGQGALASWTQAQVSFDTRFAAQTLGGTKMDKPEGIGINKKTGKVYCVLTNNPARGAAGQLPPDAANPRANNVNGHIVEIAEDNSDASSLTFTWEIFIQCGDPLKPADYTYFGGYSVAEDISPISNPDNLVFDLEGNAWIGTDGLRKGFPGMNDGLFAVPTEGPDRGHLRMFMSAPWDAEVTGPTFNSDNSALFVSIQHPGRFGLVNAPTSRFPDGGPARPGVVVVTKKNGKKTIGS